MCRTIFHRGLGLLTGAAVLAVCACDLDVVPNRDSVDESSAVYGTALVPDGVLGDVILTRYLCDNPPPPVGTGRPIDFIIVPRIEFDKGSADFVFPSIPAPAEGEDPLCNILFGFMDADHDWSPFYGVTGQVTKGDVEATQVVFETLPPDESGRVPAVEDLQIYIENPIAHDRPSWSLKVFAYAEGSSYVVHEDEDVPLEIQLGKQQDTPPEDPYDVQILTLDLNPLDNEIVTHDEPMFEVVFNVDADEDGLPDDDNGDSLPDILWPRVLFLQLDQTDERLLTTVDPPMVIPGVVLALNGADFTDSESFVYVAYLDAGLPIDGQSVLPWHHLAIALPEVVVYDLATASLDLLENAGEYGLDPVGIYQVLVMNASGQVWSTPNELAGFGVEDQDLFLTVVP